MAESEDRVMGRGVRLFTTTSFNQAARKLDPAQKAEFDRAVKSIAGDVECGEEKAGDLVGI